MYEEEFPIRLAKLRTTKGISARDMSLSIGQNAGYINNIETGKALPSMSGFFFICEFLIIFIFLQITATICRWLHMAVQASHPVPVDQSPLPLSFRQTDRQFPDLSYRKEQPAVILSYRN